MHINYKLDEKDYLNFHLFCASKNPVISKQRKRTTILLIIAFLIFTYLLYSIDTFIAIIFGITGLVLTVANFFFFDKKRYEKLYKKNIKVNFKEKINKNIDLNFTDENIIASDLSMETKINHSTIILIEEIQDFYFLKLQNSDRLVIPKRAISNKPEFENYLKNLINKLNIKIQSELDWKWK